MEWLLNNLEWIVGSIITILGLIFGVSFIIKKNVQKSGKNSYIIFLERKLSS